MTEVIASLGDFYGYVLFVTDLLFHFGSLPKKCCSCILKVGAFPFVLPTIYADFDCERAHLSGINSLDIFYI